MTGARPANAADTAAGATPIANPAAATPLPTGPIGYVFNVQTQDVTLFDPATRAVIATKPLGAVVQWLSNEQRFWDGRHIWTYDFPEDVVRAIAIDPRKIALDRALPSGGSGPAHSLMLTPDLREAWVNVAGSDYLAIFDLASGEVAGEVKTGKFP
ncbi:MAG: hypothetical protein IT337_13900 [Thermomicrobiales bacterium]|nr:hypothetical protein [Thermomicrobiales bacterium]